jgi:hypothetical protein
MELTMAMTVVRLQDTMTAAVAIPGTLETKQT